MRETSKLQGRIVATIENNEGDILQKAAVDNFVSDAFSRFSLLKMFLGNNESTDGGEYGLQKLRRIIRMGYSGGYSNVNLTYVKESDNHGIYCMNSSIDIDSNTFWAPYCHPANLITLPPNVTFFNVNGLTWETKKTIIPNDNCSYFDVNTNEFIQEYKKTTGSGIINSIAIGKSHENNDGNSFWGFGVADPNPPIGLITGDADNKFMVEPTTGGDFIWTYDTTAGYRLNPVSKVVTVESTVARSNIIANRGAIVVGANAFRTSMVTWNNNTNFVVRLHYCLDFRNSTVWNYIDFNFPVANGGITGGINDVAPFNVMRPPALISRPDTGKLELFATTSMGAHTQGGSPVYGFHLQKATIDPLNPTGSPIISSLGLIPYAIGRRYDGGVDTFELGQYDLETGRYRLPFRYYWDDASNTMITPPHDSNWTPAIETSDFITFSTTHPVTWDTKKLWPFYVNGKKRYLSLGTLHHEWIWMSQLVSGANLNTTLIKDEGSIFRLQYRYRLS